MRLVTLDSQPVFLGQFSPIVTILLAFILCIVVKETFQIVHMRKSGKTLLQPTPLLTAPNYCLILGVLLWDFGGT